MPEGGYRWEQHEHEAVVHTHGHYHVTHNHVTHGAQDHSGGEDGFEHLSFHHEHEHGHSGVAHAHHPHEDYEREHAGEGHSHDHDVAKAGRPAAKKSSPRKQAAKASARPEG